MQRSSQTSSHPILDELHEALEHVLTALDQKWEDVSLALTPIQAVTERGPERTFRLEGPGDLSVRIRFGVYPLGDGTYEVYVEIEEGPTCRFTCNPSGDDADEEVSRLGRKVTAALLKEIEPRLGDTPESASGSMAAMPTVILDRDGAISDLNAAAREALDYSETDHVDPNFFSHVHGQNLRRVIRDLTRMVSQDLQRARWLLRLHTGSNRWRWYRARAVNQLQAAGRIQIRLCPLGRSSPASAQ